MICNKNEVQFTRKFYFLKNYSSISGDVPKAESAKYSLKQTTSSPSEARPCAIRQARSSVLVISAQCRVDAGPM